jgi:HSP20 family protein
MATTATQAQQTDISDWPGSPLSTVHHLTATAHPIPVEQYPDGSAYVIRLELPGIDPERDLEVTVQTGILSVRAYRRDETPTKHDSEFRYGTFARHLALPLGSSVQDVSAAYHNGILTVRVGMEPEHQDVARKVPVEVC